MKKKLRNKYSLFSNKIKRRKLKRKFQTIKYQLNFLKTQKKRMKKVIKLNIVLKPKSQFLLMNKMKMNLMILMKVSSNLIIQLYIQKNIGMKKLMNINGSFAKMENLALVFVNKFQI